MELLPLENMDWESWDELITPFDTTALFHRSAWLEFVEKTQGVRRLFLEIRTSGGTVGFFVGFIIRKGPFKILGSPLTGWTTQFMGPVVRNDFSQTEFLQALETYCIGTGIDQLEISNPILKPDSMLSSGFKCRKDVTPILYLTPDEDVMWRKLEAKSCRYKIRKAIKNGLFVEDTDDPAIIDQYYDHLVKVFVRQGLMPTYSRDVVRTLFECLRKRNMLFALRAKKNDKVIATAFFPHDDYCVYYWGGSSDFEFRALCPNELIQWSMIKMATQSGIKKYDMYGGRNPFKLKFGADLFDVQHWVKSYNPIADIARSLYGSLFSLRQRISGSIRRLLTA